MGLTVGRIVCLSSEAIVTRSVFSESESGLVVQWLVCFAASTLTEGGGFFMVGEKPEVGFPLDGK